MTCNWTPSSNDPIAGTCPNCGHIDLIHIHTTHCPLCELEGLIEDLRETIRKLNEISGH